MCIFADINGRLGSNLSSAVGPLAPDDEDLSGWLFHEILLHHDLVLPSTFPAIHSMSRHATWQGKAGDLHRIDFLAIPLRWLPGSRSEVNDDIDIVVKRRDHWPLLVQAQPRSRQGAPAFKHRPTMVSRDATKDPSAQAQFQDVLSFAPLLDI